MLSSSLPTFLHSLLAAVFLGLVATAPAAALTSGATATAIASLTDPAKLSTLKKGDRAANPRLKKAVYWLAEARLRGYDPDAIIDQAQRMNREAGSPRAALVKESLLRNLDIMDKLGCMDSENLARMRRGLAPVITKGPYKGQDAEVDHIVPKAVCPEVENEIANLELLPMSLNRSKSARIGERQRDMARKFFEAGLISEKSYKRVLHA